MKVIHVLRKPCSEGTVAANVLRWGAGALNIDATRIGSVEDVPAGHATRKSDYPQSYKGDGAGWGRTRGGHAGDEVHWEPKAGRWPANLVLQHFDGCVQDGTKKVKASSPASGPTLTGVSTSVARKKMNGVESSPHYCDPDGTETIAAWTCAPGCPVAALDVQSGVSKSAGGRIGNAKGAYTNLGSTGWSGKHAAGDPGFGDTGGASRFFRQVKP